MTLTVRGSLNKNTAIVSEPGPPDLIRLCLSCAIPGIFVKGWVGGIPSDFFCPQTVQAQVWPKRSKLSETLMVFLIFFYINKGADKTGGAKAGTGHLLLQCIKGEFLVTRYIRSLKIPFQYSLGC